MQRQPLSLYKLSAYTLVDNIESVDDVKKLPLPPIIIKDLIRKHQLKDARMMFSVLAPYFRKYLKPSKPVQYLDSDDDDE